jgi:flagellar L-ring protein precursor FlgH
MKKINSKSLLPWALAVTLLASCSNTLPPPPQTLKNSPDFAPIQPVARAGDAMGTGAIYNGRPSDNWFGGLRSYQVGDSITVLLNETTQASRAQNANLKRQSSNALPSGAGATLSGLVDGNTTSSVGTGTADQSASLSGDVSVTVIEVLANGNLVVRGEKQLALTNSSEVIQVSGIVRPEDISRNNTVLSKRLANAQIAYRGSGDLADTAQAGWGTRLFLKYWPF